MLRCHCVRAPAFAPTLARMAERQPNNPLHGLKLEEIVNQLVAHYGWQELGEHIPINCFRSDPSVSSSLKFLRRTPWARARVEALFLQLVARRTDD